MSTVDKDNIEVTSLLFAELLTRSRDPANPDARTSILYTAVILDEHY